MNPLEHEPYSEFGGMRTQARNMRDVFQMLERLARTDLTITLVGETGCGKSRLARAVHAASARADAPLTVFEADISGDFAETRGGTLLIEEATELPPELQARLLRTLDGQHARSSMSNGPELRILVTSNRELETEVAGGRFRADLYFRLAAAVVRVPPLRDRREDIPQLIGELLEDLGRGGITLATDALAYLQARPWFGNVRELKNVLACVLALLDGDTVGLRDLERLGFAAGASPLEHLSLAGISLEQLEKTAIKQTLARARGNKVRAAKMLGIAVSTLYEKLKRLSLE